MQTLTLNDKTSVECEVLAQGGSVPVQACLLTQDANICADCKAESRICGQCGTLKINDEHFDVKNGLCSICSSTTSADHNDQPNVKSDANIVAAKKLGDELAEMVALLLPDNTLPGPQASELQRLTHFGGITTAQEFINVSNKKIAQALHNPGQQRKAIALRDALKKAQDDAKTADENQNDQTVRSTQDSTSTTNPSIDANDGNKDSADTDVNSEANIASAKRLGEELEAMAKELLYAFTGTVPSPAELQCLTALSGIRSADNFINATDEGIRKALLELNQQKRAIDLRDLLKLAQEDKELKENRARLAETEKSLQKEINTALAGLDLVKTLELKADEAGRLVKNGITTLEQFIEANFDETINPLLTKKGPQRRHLREIHQYLTQETEEETAASKLEAANKKTLEEAINNALTGQTTAGGFPLEIKDDEIRRLVENGITTIDLLMAADFNLEILPHLSEVKRQQDHMHKILQCLLATKKPTVVLPVEPVVEPKGEPFVVARKEFAEIETAKNNDDEKPKKSTFKGPIPWEQIHASVRNKLEGNNITTPEELSEYSPSQLFKLKFNAHTVDWLRIYFLPSHNLTMSKDPVVITSEKSAPTGTTQAPTPSTVKSLLLDSAEEIETAQEIKQAEETAETETPDETPEQILRHLIAEALAPIKTSIEALANNVPKPNDVQVVANGNQTPGTTITIQINNLPLDKLTTIVPLLLALAPPEESKNCK
ncbi:MAG TPA: hypothetical protein DDX47_05115 [Candidatus Jacksonbacteria bacterium]|nr:MAG: hypothetical protein A2240_03905 [Candidatus Jacksonbacteria bacterium RIFOXYA2_FULL_43_12]OGY75918.1 MAG: hypothetical protein A2295_03170 [Candidatus Jacksonbacteria bacterium RIFOXYB2_FULL_44_15]HBH46710.1 hypothetical protein [Candidatus Jacksonbacteria bacterium]HCE48571.1 hypothetical protein [Candidatus Jacksonbacteria bacterium]